MTLFDLIETTESNSVLFVSGDVHFSEISKFGEGDYPLYDFTSSGMTHSNQESQHINSYRIGGAYAGLNFGMIQIDWERKDPAIWLQTFGRDNRIKIQHSINLSDLYL